MNTDAMNIKLTKEKNLKRTLKVSVSADEYQRCLEKHLIKIGAGVRLDGFRKGRIPLPILKQQYGAKGRNQAVSELGNQAFAQAVKEHKLQPVAAPQIILDPIESGQDISLSLSFEVFPKMGNLSLAKKKIKKPVSIVTEADIDQSIEDLKRRMAKPLVVERKSKKDDRVWYHLKTQKDEPGQASSIDLSDSTPRAWVKAFTGTLAGMQVDLKPPLVPHELSVEIDRVESLTLAKVDAQFIKHFDPQIDGIEAFRARIKDLLEREFNKRVKQDVRRQVLDVVIKVAAIDVPEALLERESQQLMRQSGLIGKDGEPAEIPDSVRGEIQKMAHKQVSEAILVGALLEQKKIEPAAAQVDALIKERAQDYDDSAQYLNYMNHPENRRRIENEVVEGQLIDALLEEMQISTHEVSIHAYMRSNSS